MPISLKLPNVDENPVLLAETRAHKINEFIRNLPYGDPLASANDLVDELQIINSQKVAFANRMNALELYRPAAIHIYESLLPRFNSSALPISKNDYAYAEAAERLWVEFGFGYKAALIDLQNKILNLNSTKSTAQVVQRAIHALKEVILVHHLTYRTPPPVIWAELHQLYFCALQQNAENIAIPEQLVLSNMSNVNSTYTQVLLMHLADPQHMLNTDILKADKYLANVAMHAELRPLGLIENPAGVFLVELDGNKPPVPFVKNPDVPDASTDILLVTVNLARQIHQHIKLLKEGVLPDDNAVPSDAVETHFEELLASLIKHFGKAPKRVFSRIKKSDGIELAIGMQAICHMLGDSDHHIKNGGQSNVETKPSRWQVLNTSAGGYALRKFNSSHASAHIGDIVAMKDSRTKIWELAILRWANINELKQLDIGLQLISPNAVVTGVKSENIGIEVEVLSLPAISKINQEASLVSARGILNKDERFSMKQGNKSVNIEVTNLVERTGGFERYQYRLI